MRYLSFIRPIAWDEVFSDWREREAERWGWEEYWKSRGFESWDAWRASYFAQMHPHPADRSWELYFVEEPKAFVPRMWAVAYRGWKRYYPAAARRARMAEIAAHSDLPANGKVIGMQKEFPSPTTIIGVRHGNEVALFEGMHRGATIALSAQRRSEVAGELLIALTEFDEETESELFEKLITQEA